MFDNRAFWSYLAFSCLMVMCLPAVYFFREFMEVRDHHFHRIVAGYFVLETVICQTLHLLGVVGVKETADFIAKLQIALKEASETGYWLELLYKTGYIAEDEYKSLDGACTNIRVMLIASVNTAKQNRQA